MHKLRKFYYDNKVIIWRYILIIASLLIVIQLLNYMIKVKNENALKNTNINSLNVDKNNTIINNPNTNTHITSNTSAVTGEQVDNTSLKKASETIENFVSACNNGNIEEAYNYLSEDCKSELYTDINKFKSLYYDTIFGGAKKSASVENWILNTYKVSITDDIMATGNANGMKTQDYITIIKDGENSKLNINSFVKKEKINKTQTIENLQFTIISKNIYMEYEEYEIKIENQTGGRVLLDTQQNTKSIYVQDSNETKYYSYSHELLSGLLKINNGFSTQLTIKFYKSYSKDRAIKNIVFSDVILNYNNIVNDEIERKKIIINL